MPANVKTSVSEASDLSEDNFDVVDMLMVEDFEVVQDEVVVVQRTETHTFGWFIGEHGLVFVFVIIFFFKKNFFLFNLCWKCFCLSAIRFCWANPAYSLCG